MLEALSTIWTAGWLLVSTPFTDVVSLTAVAAFAVLAILAAGVLRRAAGFARQAYGVQSGVRSAPRRAHAVPRHSDPDAAGRARPRAPTADLAA